MATKPKQAKAVAAPAAPPPPAEAPRAGRPSSYEPVFAGQAYKLCALGATDPELADFFDVTVRTINRWKVSHAAFAEAVRKGKEPADDRVEDSLYHRAMGTEYERAHPIKLKKIVYDASGKKVQEEERVEIVMVKEVIPADTTAMIFWLKNRRAQEWRDVTKHEHGRPGDFDGMSDQELNDFIVTEAKELLIEAAPPKRVRSGNQTKH